MEYLPQQCYFSPSSSLRCLRASPCGIMFLCALEIKHTKHEIITVHHSCYPYHRMAIGLLRLACGQSYSHFAGAGHHIAPARFYPQGFGIKKKRAALTGAARIVLLGTFLLLHQVAGSNTLFSYYTVEIHTYRQCFC